MKKIVIIGVGTFLNVLYLCASSFSGGIEQDVVVVQKQPVLVKELRDIPEDVTECEELPEKPRSKAALAAQELPARRKKVLGDVDFDQKPYCGARARKRRHVHFSNPEHVSSDEHKEKVDHDFPTKDTDGIRAYDARRETLRRLCLLYPYDRGCASQYAEIQAFYGYFCKECGPISREFPSKEARDSHYTLHTSLVTEWGKSYLNTEKPMWWCSALNGGCGLILNSHKSAVAHFARVHEHLPVCDDCKTVFESKEAEKEHDCD